MLKKLAILAGSGALALSSVIPAFALDIRVENDDTDVTTTAIAGAYTGENSQTTRNNRGGFRRVSTEQSISTGDATAYADANSVTNKTVIDAEARRHSHHDDIDVENDDTTVDTLANATADSGLNVQTVRNNRGRFGRVRTEQRVTTDDARSDADAGEWTNVTVIDVD